MVNEAVRVLNTTGFGQVDPISTRVIGAGESIVVDSYDIALFYKNAGWSIAANRHVGKRGLNLETNGFNPYKPIETYFSDAMASLKRPTIAFCYGRNLNSPMACNDRLGCCTISGAIHMSQVQALLAKVPWSYVGDAVTESVYFGLTGGQDTGLQLSQVIEYLSKPNALNYQIVGAASVDIEDFDLMSTVLYNFGALYLALQLPTSAEVDFAKHLPWNGLSGPIAGGHCVVGNGTSNVLTVPVTKQTHLLDIFTWASDTECDKAFWQKYGVQAIVVIPKWFIDVGHDAIANLNKAQALADLQAIGNARAIRSEER